ncbi:MAG: hypothetical protein AAFN18_09800 [Cyanobacteria bacterium J06554_6]
MRSFFSKRQRIGRVVASAVSGAMPQAIVVVLAAATACGAAWEPTEAELPETDAQPSYREYALETPDTLSLPPTRQAVSTAAGDYSFEVEAADNWASRQAVGRLHQHIAGRDETMWEQMLPQEYGPRFMVVGPQGQVLLLDEFINVASPYAVMLLDSHGDVIAQHSFDDIEAALGVHRSEIVAQANHGWWISDAPVVNEAAGQVGVATGGKTLIIDLTTGQIGL